MCLAFCIPTPNSLRRCLIGILVCWVPGGPREQERTRLDTLPQQSAVRRIRYGRTDAAVSALLLAVAVLAS
jgi:hypothetical protein